MKVIIVDDYAALNKEAADVVVSLANSKPSATIIWPTGSTPVGAAAELAARKNRSEFEPSKLRFVQLDEYAGIAQDDPRTLFGWMDKAILKPLNVCDCNVIRFDTEAANLDNACKAFDAEVRHAGGIDLCVLGLGPNGHIGFNEPPAPADAPTRVVTLSDESIESNSHYWGGRDKVPPTALTAGMATLLASRHIVLLVSGAHKRDILRKVLTGPVSPTVPASFLQTAPNVTIIADRAAFPLAANCNESENETCDRS